MEIKQTPNDLRVRRRYSNNSDGYTPYVSDGDSARVLFYMNISGAYGGYTGQEQAERDATLFAGAPRLLEAVHYALTHEDCTETRDVLRAALTKAGGIL